MHEFVFHTFGLKCLWQYIALNLLVPLSPSVHTHHAFKAQSQRVVECVQYKNCSFGVII